MSEVRDRYYKCLEGWGYVTPESREYVAELEKQLTELKESQKQKQIIKLCERLDEAEQQINGTCKWKYDENYNMYETDCENAFIFIEGRKSDNGFLFCPYCGKKIEEVIK